MGLLLVIALIFTTGNFVEVSATDKTICDVMPENTTCTQFSCDQPPCSLQCLQSYDSCLQNCNETTCNTVACSSSVTRCNQDCPNGYCKEYRCDARNCFQKCTEGGNCTTMRCTNSMSGSSCEQGDAKELFCDSKYASKTVPIVPWCAHPALRTACNFAAVETAFTSVMPKPAKVTALVAIARKSSRQPPRPLPPPRSQV